MKHATKLLVRSIENSFGIILPKEAMKKLHVKAGDTLYLTEKEDSAVLTSYDPKSEFATEAYNQFSQRYRNALKKLAKK